MPLQPFQPLMADTTDGWGVAFKKGAIVLQASHLWLPGDQQARLDRHASVGSTFAVSDLQ